jgi:hypothetical protein
MNEPRAARYALHLFPAEWRARYGDEFAALLAQTGLSPGIAYDILLAAVDARLNFKSRPKGWPVMVQRLRRSELVVFVSWVVFAVAGLAFAKLNEDNPFTAMRASQLPVALSFDLVIVGAVIALGALLLAGVPIATAIAIDAVRRRRPAQIVLLVLPAIVLGGWIAITLILLWLAQPNLGDLARLVFFLAWTGSFVLAALAGAVALGVAALNAQIDGTLYRRAVLPSYVTVMSMVLVTVAVVGWGLATLASDSSAFWGYQGFLATSTALSWLAIAVVMVGSSGVAIRAAVHLHREQAAAS